VAKREYDIGAEVHCQDGNCGRLSKVVVDPRTKRVTDLIVEKGFLLKRDRVLPVDEVERVEGGRIYLSVSVDNLPYYPEYREVEFTAPAPAAAGEYSPGNVQCWRVEYTVACPEPVTPVVHREVHEGVPPEMAVIERGTPVVNKYGPVGRVDHLLIDAESGELTHLVIRRGLLPYHPILSMSEVERVGEDGVTIRLTEREVDALPRYRRRAAEDIGAELRDKLNASPQDLSGVQFAVEEGIVRLTGKVPGSSAAEEAERLVRSVEGVVDVENAIEVEQS
jgi:uncharacterized protein YrrD